MAQNPAVSAMFRTTTALTTLEGSSAENVLPSEVRGVVNCRILPGDTTEGTLERVRRLVADPRVRVEYHPDFLVDEPVELHPDYVGDKIENLPGWKPLKATIEEVFPGCPVIPYLNTAQTDSRHYARLAPSILRFAPVKLTPEEIDTIHGHDERISVENFLTAIRFFTRLLEEL